MLGQKKMLILGMSLVAFTLPSLAQVKPNPAVGSSQSAIEISPSERYQGVLSAPATESRTTTRTHLGRTFWLGWGLAAGLSVADAEMTMRCEHLAGCSEANPLFPKRPSRLELYAPRVGLLTAGMLLCRHWKRKNPESKDSTILILTTDAAWSADTAWDAHELHRASGHQ
jgi:hypothetical protein